MQLRIGIRNDWPQLATIINKALATITPEEHQRINRRWMDYEPPRKKTDGALNLSPEQRAWLAGHLNFRLGINPGGAPFEFMGKDKRYFGIASGYIRWIEKRLGNSMKVHKGLTWGQALEKGRKGQIDIFPCIAPSPSRSEFLNFTKPYLSFPVVIATRTDYPFISGLEELAGKRVAVCKGFVSHEILQTRHSDLKLVATDTVEKALQEVEKGKAEAFVGNLASIIYATKEMGLTNLKIASMTPYTFSLSIGVRKDWPELVTILDKALGAIPSFCQIWCMGRVRRLSFLPWFRLQT